MRKDRREDSCKDPCVHTDSNSNTGSDSESDTSSESFTEYDFMVNPEAIRRYYEETGIDINHETVSAYRTDSILIRICEELGFGIFGKGASYVPIVERWESKPPKTCIIAVPIPAGCDGVCKGMCIGIAIEAKSERAFYNESLCKEIHALVKEYPMGTVPPKSRSILVFRSFGFHEKAIRIYNMITGKEVPKYSSGDDPIRRDSIMIAIHERLEVYLRKSSMYLGSRDICVESIRDGYEHCYYISEYDGYESIKYNERAYERIEDLKKSLLSAAAAIASVRSILKNGQSSEEQITALNVLLS